MYIYITVVVPGRLEDALMKSKLEEAKPLIEEFFDSSEKKIYKNDDLNHILHENQDEWKLPASIRWSTFLNFLLMETNLTKVRLIFKTRAEIRFVWGDVSIYELGLSLKKGAYLTHLTAAVLHGLVNSPQTNVYVNFEQPRKLPKGELSQESIDFAFRNAVRVT